MSLRIVVTAASHKVMGKPGLSHDRKSVAPRYVAEVIRRARAWGFDAEQHGDLSIGISRPGAAYYDVIFYVDEDSEPVHDLKKGDRVVWPGDIEVHDVLFTFKRLKGGKPIQHVALSGRVEPEIELVHHVVE